MLDSETRRRIDTARDILVGKVPDPKSQVEQITIALIYKFMDDMDIQSEELGGKRTYFSGDFAKYSWARLLAPGMGGFDMLNLYSEALLRMPENPGLPMLFRDIFKNAYLPYRDPETLRIFLKVINEFIYDHSERLGDAFEYLLSIMGSQGDAGQFRTPRHIIDFMVETIDPQKEDSILDPACGTAGFLISAFKHIMASNSEDGRPGEALTPDERARLLANIKGYDISPDMVRLSLANLYLHDFTEPHVFEYDTLTSEERWNEYYDVILANPPFMSPKGGIRPHNRFSVQSKRSEVLFVDYIAEHLSPRGRAAVIVPEGIIFQSQNAYKALRKMLVEEYLVGVISLPTGVFNPYSGVKTSILWLDKALAQKTDSILFIKIENDGFDLGSQRRIIKDTDLPDALNAVETHKRAIAKGTTSELGSQTLSTLVPKTRISEDGEYILSGDRYKIVAYSSSLEWPLVSLGELCTIERGASPRPIRDYITDSPEGVNWIKIGDASEESRYITHTKEKITLAGVEKSRQVKPGDFILSNSMSYGRPYIMAIDGCIHDGWLLLRDFSLKLSPDYLYYILGSPNVLRQFERAAIGGVVKNLNSKLVRNVEIPVPPLSVQEETVAELDSYQKIVDGARQVVDNYRPRIPIDPEWPLVKIGDIFGISRETVQPSLLEPPVTYLSLANITQNTSQLTGEIISTAPAEIKSLKTVFKSGDILYGKLRPNLNKVWLADRDGICSTDIFVIEPLDTIVEPAFYMCVFTGDDFNAKVMRLVKGAQLPRIGWTSFANIEVPQPSVQVQRDIAGSVAEEQALIRASEELINRYEQKIRKRVARVWGEN